MPLKLGADCWAGLMHHRAVSIGYFGISQSGPR